jgi:hypothetical protein
VSKFGTTFGDFFDGDIVGFKKIIFCLEEILLSQFGGFEEGVD